MIRIFGENPEYSNQPVSDCLHSDIICTRNLFVFINLYLLIYMIWYLIGHTQPTDPLITDSDTYLFYLSCFTFVANYFQYGSLTERYWKRLFLNSITGQNTIV